MKLKIKKFAGLSDLDVSLPCVVSGDNATGKTTIARAYLYVLGLPDACGKDFVGGGERGIYNRENPDFAEVTLETGDKILTRRSDGKTVRKKGEDVEEFIPVVTNTYFVDGSAVGQVDHAKAVGIEFDFISIENFWRKDQKTQCEIISKVMQIEAYEPMHDAKLLVTNINAHRKEISAKKAVIAENEIVIEQLNNDVFDVEDKSKLADEITALQKAVSDAVPFLSAEDEKHNETLIAEIRDEQSKVYFEDEPVLIDLTNEIANAERNLQTEKTKAFESEKTTEISELRKAIKTLTDKIAEIEDLQATNTAKCSKCSHCTLHATCEHKTTGKITAKMAKEMLEQMPSIADLKSTIATNEGQIERLEKEQNAELAEFETTKKQRVSDAEKSLKDAQAKQKAETDVYNEEFALHSEKKSEFEVEKRKKIETLQAKMRTPLAVDNTERIAKIETLQKEYNDYLQEKSKLDAILHEMTSRGEKITQYKTELQSVQNSLVADEKKQIAEKSNREKYNAELQEKFAKFGGDFDFVLSRKNLSNDEYSDCFEVYFGGKNQFSNAENLLMKSIFAERINEIMGVKYPIVIDECGNIVSDQIAEKLPKNAIKIFPKKGEVLNIKNETK